MSEQTNAEAVSAEAVRRSLDGCLRSPAFRRSQKLAAFLSYVVEEELAGRGEGIKAYTIATQALGRADTFDPGNDPSVRVEAGRLRRVLDEVYADEGRQWPIRILVPVGAYRPTFEPQCPEPQRHGRQGLEPQGLEPQGLEPRTGEGTAPGEAPRPIPAPALMPPTAVQPQRRIGAQALALFDTRGQAVLALLLAVIAFLLAVEVALQIYVLTHA